MNSFQIDLFKPSGKTIPNRIILYIAKKLSNVEMSDYYQHRAALLLIKSHSQSSIFLLHHRLSHRRTGSLEVHMMTLMTCSYLRQFSRLWLDSRGCSLSTTSRKNPWLWKSSAKPPTATSMFHLTCYSFSRRNWSWHHLSFMFKVLQSSIWWFWRARKEILEKCNL